MRNVLMIAGILLGGCSLYGDGDDVGAEVDGGGAVDASEWPSMGGTWAVTWRCGSTECGANPLGTVANIAEDGASVSLAWRSEAHTTLLGTRENGGRCAWIPGGVDGDDPRDPSSACFLTASAPDQMELSVAWTSAGLWVGTMTR